MTDLEVIEAVRRRMAGIEVELFRDQAAGACTKEQWAAAMSEYTKEFARAHGLGEVVLPGKRA